MTDGAERKRLFREGLERMRFAYRQCRASRTPGALRFGLAPLSLSLAACSAPVTPAIGVEDAAALPVTCYSRPDCSAKIARARTWIAAHTTRPIVDQALSIKTATPSAADRRDGFTVTVSLREGGGATIAFSADCWRSCRPPAEQLLGDFNLYLSASNPAPLTPLSASAEQAHLR